MHFEQLQLIEPLLAAIADQGYLTPTPIQEKAIPQVLAGRDLLGCAQTGTGKTAAFALPILQKLALTKTPGQKAQIRTLVLAPTRELASQIGASFAAYGARTSLRHAVIFGGVPHAPQVRRLKEGVDILVATPGRLLDFMGQGIILLGQVEILVLDEADRMLDMGFIRDIRKILAALPRQRQTLLFSATLQPEICQFSGELMRDPVQVSVAPPATTLDKIEQGVFFVEKQAKIGLLIDLLSRKEISRVLVFTRTKHGADKVVKNLARASIQASAIHGNKSQGNRERALDGFRQGTQRVLVATDIAARGLDIDAVSHVINFDLPRDPECYVHRIGRTGRMGAIGVAISFCDHDERTTLAAIERLTRKRLSVLHKLYDQEPRGERIERSPRTERFERSPRSERIARSPRTERFERVTPHRVVRAVTPRRVVRAGPPRRAP